MILGMSPALFNGGLLLVNTNHMQIDDGHQCDLQQPEDISPAKQKLSGKAEEKVEVENERCGHQLKQFTVS